MLVVVVAVVVVRVDVTVVVVTEVVVTEVVVGGGILQDAPDHLLVQTQVNDLCPSMHVPWPLHGSAVALQSLTATVHWLPVNPVPLQSHPQLPLKPVASPPLAQLLVHALSLVARTFEPWQERAPLHTTPHAPWTPPQLYM